jgi:hypothetical protein
MVTPQQTVENNVPVIRYAMRAPGKACERITSHVGECVDSCTRQAGTKPRGHLTELGKM